MHRLISVFGLMCLLCLAWILSSDRRKINFRTVGTGIGLQLLLGVLLLKFEPTSKAFGWFAGKVAAFLGLSKVGARFVFGVLADQETMEKLFDQTLGLSGQGMLFIIHVVSTIMLMMSFAGDVKESMIVYTTFTRNNPLSMGNVIFQKLSQPVAPSILASSKNESGID